MKFYPVNTKTRINMQKMYSSVGMDNTNSTTKFYDKEIHNLSELADITANHNYSNISFKSGYRKGMNFQGVSILALDVDDGYSINEVKVKLKGVTYLLVTTRHHRLSVKNGKAIEPKDKYRLFFPLEEPITDPALYQTIIKNLIKDFRADEKCCDLARFYYCNPNQEVHYGE